MATLVYRWGVYTGNGRRCQVMAQSYATTELFVMFEDGARLFIDAYQWVAEA